MSRKRVLFLTTRFPYPPIGGDKLKAFNLLKIMSKHYDVKLIAWSYFKLPKDSYLELIKSLGVEVEVLRLNPFKAALNCGLKLFSGLPFEISFYNLSEFRKAVETSVKYDKIDVVVAFFMRSGEFVKNMQIKKLLVAEDCRTLYQKRSYEQTDKFLQKIVRYHEWKKLHKYEKSMMDKFDAVSFVTEHDISSIKNINPHGNYKLLTNGTDVEHYKDSSKREPYTLLFAGKMNVHSNQISAIQLAKEILPVVAKAVPEVKLIIAGADMNAEIRNLASDKIEIIENVSDMLPQYQRATIFVNPHRGGSGIQNKLLEALACGCSVITTITGIQGINGIDGEHLIIANDSTDFARKIIKLLGDEDLRAKIGTQARKLILETHTWDVVELQLLSIMNGILNE
ncbi:MAG: glycosyltransferase [Desulfobulbaceae bacterium]|nr:glycosyltransferase [Candidatus Kapabacteria bacterium]MBS3998871.1 glycosyltransferase [Desulfobulbaceae bacterium]